MILIFSYLIGSIQPGVLLAKYSNIQDPRFAGSNNIGTTNMWRIHGWKYGIATFILDTFKILVIYKLSLFFKYNESWIIYAMSLGVMGQLYPVQNFHLGGKGIACTMMLLLLNKPWLFLISATTWLLTFAITRTSGISACISIIITLAINIYISHTTESICVSIILALCLFKHKANIINAIIEYRATGP